MREEFDTPTTQDIRQWRLFLASQLRRSKDARRCFSGSENDWKRMIRSLENPGVYENPCGDLMLPALAHSLCVDVILFNTRRTSAPIYPVSSTVWGGSHPAEDAEDNQYQEFQELHSEINEFWIKKPNQMANRTLNFEAGNGNWWGPRNHERKLLIGPEHALHWIHWHISCSCVEKYGWKTV